MNNWTGIGRLTKDVELQYASTGTAIATFTVAINRKFKNQNGEYDADFIRCKAFRKTAEVLSEHTSKGAQIGLEGTIQTGKFDNQEGKTIFTTDVIVNSFTFIDSKKKQSVNQSQVDTYNKEWQGAANDGKPTDIDDSMLPF